MNGQKELKTIQTIPHGIAVAIVVMMPGDDERYELLRQKLSKWPIRLPEGPEAIALLKLLYTPEQVELLLTDSFPAPYQNRKSAEEVAAETGRLEKQTERILNDLADRGLLFRMHDDADGRTTFTLFPILPGFFEFYITGEKNPNLRKKFSQIIESYYHSGLADEIGSSNYPWVRVLPAEKNLMVNLPLDPTVEILPFEVVSEYISTSKLIALMNCACRLSKRCAHPLETCICFDNYAKYMVERGLARYLSVAEALDKLKSFEALGLVHTTTNCQVKPQFICSCCTCSCLMLRGLTEFHNPKSFSKSNFHPRWEKDRCNGCEICIEICPMDALSLSRPDDEFGVVNGNALIALNEDRCIGCGLCASNCPEDAIVMYKIHNELPEGTLRGMWLRTELERTDGN